MFSNHRARILVLVTVISLILTAGASAGGALTQPSSPQRTVADIDTLGWIVIPNDLMVDGTTVGGLSSLVYDGQRDVYYALSDDKGEFGDPRFYSLEIDVSDFSLDDGDVQVLEATFLQNHMGDRYGFEEIDAEGFEMTRPGHLFIGSEGNIDGGTWDPFIDRFSPDGKQNRALPFPPKFAVAEDSGPRDNLVWESLTATPNQHKLFAGLENALVQDGPIATNDVGSPARVLEYDLRGLRPGSEYVYCVDPIPQPIQEGGFGDNGLVELQALDDQGTFLAMERSFVLSFGNTISLYQTTTRGATEVSGVEALGWADCPGGDGSITPMEKTFLADFTEDLGVPLDVLDNMEGMAFGPPLPDGRLPLIVVSDNNFNFRFQETIVAAFAVTLEDVH